MGSVIRVYSVVYDVMWDFEDGELCEVCFGYKSNINFVYVEKGLEFQLVIGKPIGVPEDYTQGGWL
jgi:hypothetical protein